MKRYRRAYRGGGVYFFTVVTHQREPWLTQPMALARLRRVIARVRAAHPFSIDAIVVMPDHLHALWRLPQGDADFSTRWRLIKHGVALGRRDAWRWQPRFWEHLVRDDADWRAHMDYIHYNPVHHGLAAQPADWPHGSFRHWCRRGWYASDWGSGGKPEGLPADVGE